MVDRKLSSTIRKASAVNLKYSADLLNLGRDYIRAFSAALTEQVKDDAGRDDESVARPALLLAGRAGETANAAFAIGNSDRLSGTVTLQVTGDFADTKVSVEPAQVSFDEEGDKIVRILAKVGRKTTPVETDMAGTVLIPELDHRVTGFVLRRLPD